ncbi:hypothetical protein CPHO_11285 [Corynebacterium phocae]|uniref:Uncharacterized protein n=1 Tax=Corynebacterium phocae TaxID=161895 RepID=A0A1L7D5Q0_9CORY|nr:hypothetical protein [Corynebacterium phocae]APT93371.1 hypothetical protein CPHO_11285 [Corynebacterium phocae]KAA8721712.1 hypothetical protein F4V58_10765 [Corynebacterium phocae]
MSEELLFYRSCAPAAALWDDARDRPSSQLFMLNSNDEGLLSVAQSAKTNPKQFYQEFISAGMASRGVWGISEGEISPVPKVRDEAGNEIILGWSEDEGPGKVTGHCLINMKRWVGKKKLKKIAQSLRNVAVERGILHP